MTQLRCGSCQQPLPVRLCTMHGISPPNPAAVVLECKCKRCRHVTEVTAAQLTADN